MIRNLLNTLKNKKKKAKGFTLIELIIVIAIIAILAAIAIPKFMEIRENELVSVSLDIGRYKGGRSDTVVGYECMLLYKFEILIKYIKQAVTLITGKALMICRTKNQTVYTGYVTQRYIAKNFLFEESPIQGIDLY